MSNLLQPEDRERLQRELASLDLEQVELDGLPLKASQCYKVAMDPLHVLFNTNCPDSLRSKVNSIISRYAIEDADSTS
jgi:hypothetical protein